MSRGYENRMVRFKQYFQKVGDIDASSALCTYVLTRWNSTFFM